MKAKPVRWSGGVEKWRMKAELQNPANPRVASKKAEGALEAARRSPRRAPLPDVLAVIDAMALEAQELADVFRARYKRSKFAFGFQCHVAALIGLRRRIEALKPAAARAGNGPAQRRRAMKTFELALDVPASFAAAGGSETPLKLERRVETGKSSGLVGVGGVLPPMLDACCGSRMFWFDRTNPLALYMDKREEQHVLCDGRELKISPDVVADFTDMPFPGESFWLVVFDPPHMNSLGANSWLAKKYGRLIGDWRDDLREGFSECFRVLKTNGTLVFKWNTTDISLEEVLALAPCPPVFGHTTGRQAKTVWATFFKGGGGAEPVTETVCDNPKSQNDQAQRLAANNPKP